MGKRWNFSLGYFALALLVLLLIQSQLPAKSVAEIPYSVFKQAIVAGTVKDVAIGASRVEGQIQSVYLAQQLPEFKAAVEKSASEWSSFSAMRVDDSELIKWLDDRKVSYRGVADSAFFKMLVSWVIPMLVMVFVWQWIFNRMGSGQGGGMMAIGKSKAKIYVDKDIKIAFKDVAGIDEAVAELQEIVDFLTAPDRYTKLGGRLPKGVLLVGPPGTGKTLLARAVAGEAKVPFFSLSGSEFVEMFVGVGAARVRDLFEQAQKNSPCIIFIDELDALGRARGMTMNSNEEREQTLNQLLTEMDGFDPNRGVVLMAATNRPEILDPALLRAGRFDRQVVVDRPDVAGREAILRIHARRVVLAEDVDLALLAARTPGFVGADLANIINEGALLAARADQTAVTMANFEEAIERVMGGLQKKSSLMTAAEKHRVAYHESGHALIAMLVDGADPVHKISIIPRGIAALGYTLQVPAEDRHIYSKAELLDRIAVLFGGRAAEEIAFGDSSTGAADDLQKATQLVRRLITEFGMSNVLGPIAFSTERAAFLGQWQEASRAYSESTAQSIDGEVMKMAADIYKSVSELLKTNQAILHELAALLEQRETVEGETARALLARHRSAIGRPLPPSTGFKAALPRY